jgi:outer membrane lipopolysaccharide assembly protein LptE/RlpB
LKAELKTVQSELGEAISVIKSLKGTINEVNLLNAKLLYVNKLFRSFNLTNEQKSKVVETLDRTKNVREVKLVFSTIAESFKFGTGVAKKTTAKLTESYASKPAQSTAPKQIIAEDNS